MPVGFCSIPSENVKDNSRVWPFELRVMLLLDRSRARRILTGTQLWIGCGHTTVVPHS